MVMATPLRKNGDVPESFGVFKPVGHVVLAFKQGEDRDAAQDELQQHGFTPAALVRYGADEMRAQVQRELQQASGAAGFGHELNVLKLHKQLAEQGHEWLIVRAPDEPQWRDVAEVAQRHEAAAAHRYGRLVIEDLLRDPQHQPGL